MEERLTTLKTELHAVRARLRMVTGVAVLALVLSLVLCGLLQRTKNQQQSVLSTRRIEIVSADGQVVGRWEGDSLTVTEPTTGHAVYLRAHAYAAVVQAIHDTAVAQLRSDGKTGADLEARSGERSVRTVANDGSASTMLQDAEHGGFAVLLADDAASLRLSRQKAHGPTATFSHLGLFAQADVVGFEFNGRFKDGSGGAKLATSGDWGTLFSVDANDESADLEPRGGVLIPRAKSPKPAKTPKPK